MKRLYIAGFDEIPQQLTLKDNDLLELTIVCPPGYSGDINFTIDLLRPGVQLDLAGLYFCTRGERQRLNIGVRHMVGGARSKQLFKGILGGGGSAVFNGLIYVEHGAGGTSALQENHSILLDTESSAETHPQLEIYADDVECSHGATVGFLNEDERFYMRSRGIPEDEARRLQILSFLSPVLSRLPAEKQEFIIGRI
ncbi:MAG: SufD family Fe-S cluster assembly protein [Bacteroidales bacterium]|nr:SufD family Fe-S cluster assembly protein [Bacteroidales bacterium]